MLSPYDHSNDNETQLLHIYVIFHATASKAAAEVLYTKLNCSSMTYIKRLSEIIRLLDVDNVILIRPL